VVRCESVMSSLSIWLKAFWHCARTINRVMFDLVELFRLATKSRSALVAENLFLRQHRAQDSARWLMACLSRLFDWRTALVVVKPDTLIRWHRRGFRLFWRWKSKPVGRPALSKNLQELIRKMAVENPTWGEEHIANELKLKLGIRVSPRTVRKYLADYRGRTPDPSQRWLTFVHNHAQAIVACDFFRGVHSRLPHPLCIRGHGTGQAPDPAS
jgi:putative transposase